MDPTPPGYPTPAGDAGAPGRLTDPGHLADWQQVVHLSEVARDRGTLPAPLAAQRRGAVQRLRAAGLTVTALAAALGRSKACVSRLTAATQGGAS